MTKPSKADLRTAQEYQRRAQHYRGLADAAMYYTKLYTVTAQRKLMRRVAEYQDMAALNAKIARGIMGIVE